MFYAFGSNGSGQLGLGIDVEDPSAPQRVPDVVHAPQHVRQISAGGNHTLAVFSDGTLSSVGNNEDGRCGHSAAQSPNVPFFTECAFKEPVKQAVATWSASTLLDTKGRVWTVGSGSSGELGLGHGVQATDAWQSISAFPPINTVIVQMASCMAHTVAVLSNGEVYGWGKGRKGQLGDPAEDVWSPRKIDSIPFTVFKAVCGKDFTCVFGDPVQGELLVLGPGSRDRFGVKANAPHAVPGRKDVAASWGSIFVLKSSGELVAWGRDDHGQLPPPRLPPIEMIAAGSEHCLVLTKAGKVLAWGWGEHGNCGEPTNPNGDVKGTWNEIEVSFPVKAIYAGCATSFIVAEDEPQQSRPSG